MGYHITWTEMTYAEAGGSETCGELKMLKEVHFKAPESSSLDEITNRLVEKALKIKGDYIFQVQFYPDKENPKGVTGTVYKRKK